MTDAFYQSYKITLKMMNCTDEEEYWILAEESEIQWYSLTEEEQEEFLKLIDLLVLTFFARNWVQNDILREKLSEIVPKANRNHQFPWKELYDAILSK